MTRLSGIVVGLFLISVVLFFTSCQSPTIIKVSQDTNQFVETLNQIDRLIEKGRPERNVALIHVLIPLIDYYNMQVADTRLSVLMKANLPHTVLMCYNSWIVTYQFAEDLRVRN